MDLIFFFLSFKSVSTRRGIVLIVSSLLYDEET